MSAPPRPAGISTEEFSDEIRVQDDLFHYVHERWIERFTIPSDMASYSNFMMLFERAEAAIRSIVAEARTAPEGSELRKCGDLYSSFLDEARVEERGAEPLRERLALVAQVRSMPEFLSVLGVLQRGGVAGLYHMFVNNDPGRPERYLAFFEQGGLSLPDESYYREAHFANVRDAFARHVERMFALAGVEDGGPRAARVLDLETQLASHHWDNVASRESEKTYNLFEWRAAADLFGEVASTSTSDAPPTLDQWSTALAGPEHALDEVVLRQPSFTRALGGLLASVDLDTWKDWLAWQVIRADAPYLSSAFVDEQFDFYGRTLTGALELRERWKRGLSLVEGALGEAVGRLFVERHFPPSAKSRMDELVEYLVSAYRASISNLEWMSDETRQRALEKLRAFTPKIGYPASWRDYSALRMAPDDLIANVRAANEFEFRRQLAKIGAPIDRDEWFMTPQTVNAYYNPGFNEIVFPAAILQPPFFDVDRDDAANFGAIGAIIGHEIGHGFDDQGSKFDGAGRLTDWWTPADRAAFEERTRVLIEQFSALSPRMAPDQHVNGALTVGENIGDLGGLGIAWRAYHLSLNGAVAPTIDGLSGAQRFFLAWAQAWRYQARPEEVERLLAIDPHAPPEFRCNQIVRNLDAFYEAFGVGPTDQLWLDPARRVQIW